MKEEILPDETLMTEEEFFAMLESAMEDVRAGRTYEMKQGESLEEFLERIEIKENI